MTLDDLVASPDRLISAAAARVQCYRGWLAKDAITKREYEALVKSATDLELVNKIADDIVRAELVKTAFNQILAIAVSYL